MLDEKIKELIKNLNGRCSVIVHDLSGDEKVFINEEEVFPAASIIKLWILWKLYAEADKGKINLDEEIILKEDHKVGGFGILQDMHSGLNLSLRDYATLMIILSDNTATNVLIDYLGMDAINEEIKKLGMDSTSLQRKMMDTEAKARGLDNFTSARDTYNILVQILSSSEISMELRQEMINILLRQQCNNKLPLLLPPDAQFAHKTGDLPGTEHDAGIFFIGDAKIAVVVMMYGLKSNLEGIQLHNQLGNTIYQHFVSKQEVKQNG